MGKQQRGHCISTLWIKYHAGPHELWLGRELIRLIILSVEETKSFGQKECSERNEQFFRGLSHDRGYVKQLHKSLVHVGEID